LFFEIQKANGFFLVVGGRKLIVCCEFWVLGFHRATLSLFLFGAEIAIAPETK
jgi:hypothetical protein